MESVSLRKAAILVAALDRQSADALLDELGPAEAARVRAAVMDLDDVSADEQQQVITEFMHRGPQADDARSVGTELNDTLARQLGNVPNPTPSGADSQEPPPFRFLHEATADGLARHLRGEHPQIIAVVVAHLQPKQGADLIKRFPEALQVDVLRRVAELDTASPEVLRDLERQLEMLLSDEIRAARNRSVGLGAVTSILEAAGTDQADLLHAVARQDAELMSLLAVQDAPRPTPPPTNNSQRNRPSSQFRGPREKNPQAAATTGRPPHKATSRPPKKEPSRSAPANSPPDARVARGARKPADLEFEDLAQLDDPSLGKVFQAAETRIVVLALTGADEQLVKRILRQFPSRQSRKLQRELRQPGPIQISDVERAQRSLAQLAEHLASRELIQLPQSRRFAVAA
jgi:flagellar motor switch protein FliG